MIEHNTTNDVQSQSIVALTGKVFTYDLIQEKNLRGYGFEYFAKIVLRRLRKNNFLFQLCQFDDLAQIEQKYRLHFASHMAPIVDLMRKEWNRCDLIEFLIDPATRGAEKRCVVGIICYDVKTQTGSHSAVDMCLSNHTFMLSMNRIGVLTRLVRIRLLDQWQFRIGIELYAIANIRVYSRTAMV